MTEITAVKSVPCIELRMGAMCPALPEQLQKQGRRVEPSKLDHYQKDADAITRLAVRGLIPAAAVNSARAKLVKKIAKDAV